MTRLMLLGTAAIVAVGLATAAMSQEATQEPGMIGFNYPNSNYLRGGYGVRTPSRYDRSYYGPRAYYGPGPADVAVGVAAGAIGGGARVVIHDDVLATGGTVEAIAGLVEQLGGTVVGVNFVIELSFLGGRERLANYDLFSLITY